jgi:hypothetical protein
MRAGIVVSSIAHAALLAWGIISLPAMKPLDASNIEQIPVDFVEFADDTKINKGVQTAALVQEVKPPPAPKVIEEPPPLPKPDPTPAPDPAPTPPPPAPAPPQPTPPDPVPAPTPTPPEPAPPEPAPVEPAPTEPAPAPPTTASIAPMKDVPKPRLRPTPPQKPKQAPPDTSQSDIDQITALLDKRKLEQMAAADAPAEPPKETAGSPTGSASVAKMTANELDMLRARLAQCWSPPLGWTDPSEVRVVLIIELNADGSVAGTPSVLEAPQGSYSTTAPESALRAVRRCAPYSLPPEKYDEWKQVKVTFDPRDMGGA